MKTLQIWLLGLTILLMASAACAITYNSGTGAWKTDAGQKISNPIQNFGWSFYGPFLASATSTTAVALIPSNQLIYTGSAEVQFMSVSGSAEYDYGSSQSLTVSVQGFPLAVSTSTLTNYLAPGQGVRVQLAPLQVGSTKNILYWVQVYR